MPEVYWDRNWPAPKVGDIFTTSHAKGSKCSRMIMGIDEDENGWKAVVIDEARNVVRITPGHLKFHSGVTRDAWRPLGTVWNVEFQCWVPPGYEVVKTNEYRFGVIRKIELVSGEKTNDASTRKDAEAPANAPVSSAPTASSATPPTPKAPPAPRGAATAPPRAAL